MYKRQSMSHIMKEYADHLGGCVKVGLQHVFVKNQEALQHLKIM